MSAHPHPVSPRTARRIAWLHRMAWLCAALVLLIIGLSAQMRLTRVVPECEPWPQCRSQLTQASATDPGTAAQQAAAPTAARTAHRTAASATLLLILAMLIVALGPRPILWTAGRMVLGLLGLTLFLAALGMRTGASALPAVTLGNLLGGFGMLALSVRLAWATAQPPERGRHAPPANWARLAILLVLVQAALGGLVSAGHAGLSCPAFGACDLGADGWLAFNPWIEPHPALPSTHAGGAWVHMTHRIVGLALVALLPALSWQAWRRGGRMVAVALTGLPILLAALGLALVALDLPLALILAHNLCAALLLALLAGIAGDYLSSPPMPASSA
uniref:COX15/CtaA family protein n=1 Tax=Castellaniella defragrans TaxID=75697 RepID=UPI003341F5EE